MTLKSPEYIKEEAKRDLRYLNYHFNTIEGLLEMIDENHAIQSLTSIKIGLKMWKSNIEESINSVKKIINC